jgi:acyl-CoA dehydrogenase
MIRDPDTLTLLQESVARFVREVLIPNDARVAELDAIPEAIVAQMRELGVGRPIDMVKGSRKP